MDEEEKGLYTVAEAAAAWGVTPQAIYQRLTNLTKEGFVLVKGKKRYITREGVEAYQSETNPPFKKLKENKQALPTLQSEIERLTNALQNAEAGASTLRAEVDGLKGELLAEQGKASSLQATVTAQEAHIETLKHALDREQSLHMAALQQRLPAGRGGGFFAWLRGKKANDGA